MKKSVKQGAASFYVIAFSTLVLMIVVASFTALIVAQITRSANDELSQSAYDSALAGVEDAKLAFYNYQACVAQGAVAKQPDAGKEEGFSCEEIVWMIEKDGDNCDTVAKILGRTITESGVAVTESDVANNMQQYYSCVKLQSSLPNYRATLSSANQMKAVQVKLDGTSASQVSRIQVSWGNTLGDNDLQWTNYINGQVEYPQFNSDIVAANPPTVAVAVVQAGTQFKIGGEPQNDSFAFSRPDRTNKGMVYLTPTNQISSDDARTYKKATVEVGDSGIINKIPMEALVKSNDKTVQKLPYAVQCSNDGGVEFACSAIIDLPQPVDEVGGARSDDNFIVAVMLPYGNPTDFELRFLCEANVACGKEKILNEDGEMVDVESEQISLKGMQVGVDSTGRANDLFRRVEIRLEGSDSHAMSIMGPLELFNNGVDGSGNTQLLFEKDYAVTSEHNL